MTPTLSSEDIDRFETLLSQTPAQLGEHKELCDRVLSALRFRSALNQADIGFLRSWLRAGDLILTGLQVLEMADQDNAEAIRHERECTQTALALLPHLLDEARSPGA